MYKGDDDGRGGQGHYHEGGVQENSKAVQWGMSKAKLATHFA